MKFKVLTVELCAEGVDAQRYFYATLSLPATAHEMQDAFQKARYDEDGGRFHDIRITECALLPQLENLRLDVPTIKELEFFANRVDGLPVEEKIALKAVFQQFLEEDKLGEIVSLKDLINMTYDLDEVMIAAGVSNDEELGQFVIENDMHQDVSAIPDTSLYLLDKAKVGQLQRHADKGVYVDEFYAVTGDYEMPEVYDGRTLPDQLHDTWYAFRLKIAEPSIASPGDTEHAAKWISLPISKAFADELAKEYTEERIEDCALYGFESSIPQITDRHFWNMKELCLLMLPIVIINMSMFIQSLIEPDVPPNFLGYTPVIVSSGSMSPEFEVTDLVIVKAPEDAASLEDGTVICYLSDNSLVTHRIIGQETASDGLMVYITQGDANNAPDRIRVDPSQIVGVYQTHIPELGKFALFMQTPTGITLFVVMPLLALFALYSILDQRRFKALLQEKEAQVATIDAEEIAE